MTEQTNVPKLRFGEFEAEWTSNFLPKIAKIERGKFTPRPRNNPIYYNGNIPFVQTSDVANSNGYIRNFTQTLNEKGLGVSKLFAENTVLITIAANIGYTGVLQIPMACPDSLINLEPVNTDPYFLHFLLSTHQRKMDNIADPGAQKNVNKAFLNKYKVTYCLLPEQQKIASFLSKVDEKIGLLSEKKDKLTEYKKGVMQQLFNGKWHEQDGLLTFTPPTLRFKAGDGSEFPDWEEKTLGDIAQIKGRIGYRGYTVNDIVEHGGAIAFSPTNIVGGQLNYSKLTRISDFKYDESPEIQLKPQDILFVKTGSTYGKSAFVGEVKERSTINPQIVVIKAEASKMSGYFLSRLLITSNVKKQIEAFIVGGAIPTMSQEAMSKFDISVPSLGEQAKMSNFLSSIDRKIELANSELEKAKEWKKGLLQQMFV
ncbi:restriction endonuclease subunit S [Vibrio splendidus]|uniref:restriction endonuclease subunit S n=1 Tax=Vibrio splendidus TaxID=29497 RepID=UPI00076A15AD|nr:restriction endonuclease subunit S [Vibrio splendidus]PHX06853.1 EcoKI restriction-modification system protein HsdS [Vibrio splendidus]